MLGASGAAVKVTNPEASSVKGRLIIGIPLLAEITSEAPPKVIRVNLEAVELLAEK